MGTAAIVLIGNELLSGKIADTNATYLVPRLRALGVDLRRIAVVPDEVQTIATEVRRARAVADVVFTSGGIGPTHDDVTYEGVAAAFGVPLVEDPALSALLTRHFGERLRPEHLRMACVPTGTELIQSPLRWPILCCQGVYILPGVPEIFRAKFDAIAERFRSGRYYLRSLYLNADEGAIAALLAATEVAHGVMIGSYPQMEGEHRVKVTVEARAAAPVNAAIEGLLGGLDAACVVRVDSPVSDAVSESC